MDAMQSHLNWRSKNPSPFISLFDDKNHAINWAKKLVSNRRAEAEDVVILIYDAHMVRCYDQQRIIKVHDVIPNFSWYKDEWLVEGFVQGEAFLEEIKLMCKSLCLWLGGCRTDWYTRLYAP